MNKKRLFIAIISIFVILFVVFRIINLNIKWQGISVEDINTDLKANLPENAIAIDEPSTQSEFLTKSYIFIIPIILIIALTIIAIKKKKNLTVDKKELRKGIVIGVMIGFLFVIIHEFIHALFYPNESIVNIGIVLNPFYAYATSINEISKISFITMSIMPFIILGVIPFILFIYYFSKNIKIASILLGFCIMGLIGGTPDLYNIYNISKQVPNNAIIINSENHTYWYR